MSAGVHMELSEVNCVNSSASDAVEVYEEEVFHSELREV